MQGLKLHVSLTLILLLASGMLLINVIITALWQRSLVNNQIENNKILLDIVATSHDQNFHEMKNALNNLRVKTNGLCAYLAIKGQKFLIPEPGCDQAEYLEQITQQTIFSGQTKATCSGKIWGVFSTQQKFLTMTVPIIDGENISGAVAMVYPLQSIWKKIREDQKIILVYMLVNTLTLTVIGFFRFASLFIRPTEKLITEATNYSGNRNLNFITELEGSELRQLSLAINRMIERIDTDRINLQKTITSLEQANKQIQSTQLEMIRTEKLASVGRLSAGMAHEIGNPLGIVIGYLGLLRQKKLTENERLEYINRSEKELNRINMLVRQLLDFSRPLPETSEPVHIHSLLNDIIYMLTAQKKNRNIQFTTSFEAEKDMVKGNEEALRQAFMNFYLNSIDAIQENQASKTGTINTESKNISAPENIRKIHIIITDNGPGILTENLPNIFDPFFTTKAPGKGTGLGLSVSYTILENTGGSVKANSENENGTSITIELPIIQDESL